MRLWSIHPKYLDTKGLVALWCEALLAKKVLEGKTKGYRNHPQLDRFKSSGNALNCINFYLSEVYDESHNRGYLFDKTKIEWSFNQQELTVTDGQLEHEREHLLKKLKTRDPQKYNEITRINKFTPHPLFKVIKGDIEDWEKV